MVFFYMSLCATLAFSRPEHIIAHVSTRRQNTCALHALPTQPASARSSPLRTCALTRMLLPWLRHALRAYPALTLDPLRRFANARSSDA